MFLTHGIIILSTQIKGDSESLILNTDSNSPLLHATGQKVQTRHFLVVF